MSFEHDEEELELATLALLIELGWETEDATGETFADSFLDREHAGEVVLGDRVEQAVGRLKPDLPGETLGDAVEHLVRLRPPGAPVRNNREVWNLLRDGAKVEVQSSEGHKQTVTVRFIVWDDPDANDWLTVRKFTVLGDLYKTRADIVGFVRGLRVVELRGFDPSPRWRRSARTTNDQPRRE